MQSQMTREQAIKELAKVAVAFKMLETGNVSRMSTDEFKDFKEWLN